MIPELLVKNFGLDIVPSTRGIIVVDGTVSKCVGNVENVPLCFEDHKSYANFLVLHESLFHSIVGCPRMGELGTCIELGNKSNSVQSEA